MICLSMLVHYVTQRKNSLNISRQLPLICKCNLYIVCYTLMQTYKVHRHTLSIPCVHMFSTTSNPYIFLLSFTSKYFSSPVKNIGKYDNIKKIVFYIQEAKIKGENRLIFIHFPKNIALLITIMIASIVYKATLII